MMCSDTSSALNEFLLTGKPVVTFKNRRPGPQLIDIDEASQFEPAIERALARPPELMQAIDDYGDAIHPYRDGHSGRAHPQGHRCVSSPRAAATAAVSLGISGEN